MTHKPRVDTVIEFGKSTSPQYDWVVSKAQRFPGYECVGEGRGLRHRIKILERSQLLKAHRILESIQNWKSSAIYYKGDPVPFGQALRRIECAWKVKNSNHIRWWCCEGHEIEGYPPETFGCRCIRLGTQYWHSHAWWRFGEMIDPVRFKVDKKALTSLVSATLVEDFLQLCPHFQLSRVLSAITRLPDVIDARLGEDWEIEYSIYGDRRIPKSIRPRRSWFERARDRLETSESDYPDSEELEKFMRDIERGQQENGDKDSP